MFTEMKKNVIMLLLLFLICFILGGYSLNSNSSMSSNILLKAEVNKKIQMKNEKRSQTGYIDLKKLPQNYTMAIAKKNGDVLYKFNTWKLEKFIRNSKGGKPDMVRITNFTDEGDAIVQDLVCRNHSIILKVDTTRDAFSNQKYRSIKQYNVVSIIKEKSLNGFVYVAKTKSAGWGLMIIPNK
jgi:hypothetical protein